MFGKHDVCIGEYLTELGLLCVVKGVVLWLKLLVASLILNIQIEPFFRPVCQQLLHGPWIVHARSKRDALRPLLFSLVSDYVDVTLHVEEDFAENLAIKQPVEGPLLVRRNDLVESRAEVLKSFIDASIVHIHVQELATLDRFILIWEHLFDQFDDIIMANIAASMTWHAIAPRDDKIHEAAEEAIQEEVQLIPVELLLRLKPEEKHDI